MGSKVVLRLSARDEILWNFHVVLDSVVEEPDGRERFARTILTQFGTSERDLEELVQRVSAKLPDLERSDMSTVLKVFENALPIEWHDDVSVIPRELTETFRAAVGRIIAEWKRSQLPKEVAAEIIEELERAIGAKLDQERVPELDERLENLLVRELWRSREEPAQRRLVDDVLYAVEQVARLKFGK